MNWLVALLTGSAELGSLAGDANKKPDPLLAKAAETKSVDMSAYYDDDDEEPFVELDESHGDPFQD